MPLLGEFNRIVRQIDQNLPQPQRITHQKPGNILRRGEKNFEILLFLGLDGHQIGQIVQHLFEVEVYRLHVEFTGFDLGKI